MPDYRLSRLALSDLKSISEYTVQAWGHDQNERYLAELRAMLTRLAAQPALGRTCDRIRKGYRRIEHGRHVIFYRIQPPGRGIEVVRILHDRMLPRKHFSDR